jgi:hypothetical protein
MVGMGWKQCVDNRHHFELAQHAQHQGEMGDRTDLTHCNRHAAPPLVPSTMAGFALSSRRPAAQDSSQGSSHKKTCSLVTPLEHEVAMIYVSWVAGVVPGQRLCGQHPAPTSL